MTDAPLSLLIAADHYPPEPTYGYDRWASSIAPELARRGHRVDVLTPRNDPDNPPEQTLNGVSVHRFEPRKPPGDLWMLRRAYRWRGSEDLLRRMDAEFDLLIGLPHFVLAAQRWAPSLRTVYRAGGTLLAARPWEDFVWPAEGSLRVKLGSHLSWRMMVRREKRAIARCDRVIVPSHNIKNQLLHYYGCAEGRVTVIPHGADPSRFRPAERADDGVLHVLTSGRLDTIKNQKLLIDALAATRGRERIEVRVAGEGYLRPRLERQIAELGLSERVTLLGYCSDIEQQYAWADVFCLPSIHEPFGIVVLEAMMAGLPVVGLRSNPPRVWVANEEMVDHEDNGLLLDSDAPAELAGALDWLCEHPDKVRAMARRSRERAEQEFTWALAAERYEATLRAIIAGEPVPVPAGVS